MQSFGVGIIGYGFMGKTHAYGHVTLPLYYDPVPCRTRLVAVATSCPETAEAAQRALGFERATTDWRELVASPDVSIVHVCTPNALHAEQVLAVLAAGKHVYCDKPLCTTAEEADRIAAALPAARGRHQMVLHNRFFPATRLAKQKVDDGFLGDLLSFRAAYLHAGSADPNAPLKWRLDAAHSGGGVLLDLGSHALDLLQHLLGPLQVVDSTVYTAHATRRRADDPTQVVPVTTEDAALLTMRAVNGAPGQVEATKIATGSMDELRFEVHGTRGALRFNLMQPNYLEAYDATQPAASRGWCAVETVGAYPPPAVFPTPKASVGWLRAHVACLHSFLTAVAEDRPAAPDLSVGVALQHLMAEAYARARRA